METIEEDQKIDFPKRVSIPRITPQRIQKITKNTKKIVARDKIMAANTNEK